MTESMHLGGASLISRLDVNTYFFNYEMIIEREVENVWPQMLNYPAWNPNYSGAKFERLAGSKDEQGEVLLVQRKTGGGYAPAVIIETVKILPNKKIVWALYSPNSGASTDIGFVDFSLRPANGNTLFTYSSYGWGTASVVGRDRAAFRKSVEDQLDEILPALKAFVEAE